VLAVIAAVGASGCGRKAGLDPPPASTVVADPAATALEPSVAPVLEPVAPLGVDLSALQAGTPVSNRAPREPAAGEPPPARTLTFLPETVPPPQALPVYGPDGKTVIPKPPEKNWFILDWLID
jgi:hypothetical protein